MGRLLQLQIATSYYLDWLLPQRHDVSYIHVRVIYMCYIYMSFWREIHVRAACYFL